MVPALVGVKMAGVVTRAPVMVAVDVASAEGEVSFQRLTKNDRTSVD